MNDATAALTGDTDVPAGDNGTTDNGTTVVTENTGSDWRSGFDEDSSAFVDNKGWENPSSMLESYRNLEKLAGGNKNVLELPGVDADPETMDRFYNKLGRPEQADGYSFELPEGGDNDMFDWFREKAYSQGLSDNQAKNLFNEFNQMSEGRIESMQNEMRQRGENDITDLKREWGRDYDKNVDSGKRAVSALGYDEQALSGLEERMGTAEMLKLFSNIGAKMGEDSFIEGNNNDGGFGQSAAGARQQLSELRTDTAFMDKYMNGDRDAVAKMTRLMEKAHG